MEYVRLGASGLQVSRIGLGTMTYGSKAWRQWVLEEADSGPFFRLAWERGVNFFDTANVYSKGVSEEIVGRALRALGPRDRQVVATKVFYPMSDAPNDGGLSRKHILSAIDASLKRLGMDYVDLYLIHRWDPRTPIEETMQALHDVVRAGKARYLGASSMSAWQFAKAQHVAERLGLTKFVAMQNHYNLVYREEEREMNPLCRDQGVAITPWSPLARGFLTGGRRVEGETKTGDTPRARGDAFAHELYYRDSDFEIARRVEQVAARTGVSRARVAIAWLLHQPGVTSPIVGASRIEQLDDILGAVDVRLGEEDRRFLEEAYAPHPVLGH